MNIADTSIMCDFLWGAYPNAPRGARPETVIASYFIALHTWSLGDAMAGAHAACLAQPRFVPSAYEVAARCKKSLSLRQTPALVALEAEWRRLDGEEMTRDRLWRSQSSPLTCLALCHSEAEARECGRWWAEYYDLQERSRSARDRYWSLRASLEREAESEYDRREYERAADDLRSLGIILPATEEGPCYSLSL